MKENSFTLRVMEHWHRLLKEVVESPSLEILKAYLDGSPESILTSVIVMSLSLTFTFTCSFDLLLLVC